MPMSKLYGLVAEFDAPGPLLHAARCVREQGYRRVEAYTPFPVEGLAEVIDARPSWLPWVVFGGGLFGAVAGYGMQYYLAVINYPINVGGRPLHSWPSFIVVTFELTVLCAALAAVLGMLALNGLPMPYHPLFNVPQFALASRNRFFLCVEALDPKFDRDVTRQMLLALHPRDVQEVPR